MTDPRLMRIDRHSALLRERYTEYRHPSGLTVLVFPKHLTTTYACLSVHYGSVNDRFAKDGVQNPAGIAHFLEHKLFENEDGSDTCAAFAAMGAEANAYTTYNRTVYLFSTAEDYAAPLDELLRFVTHPHFTQASVEKERGIITEEIREYNDNPWDRCYQELLCALFRTAPVREQICGTPESIRRITPELLYRAHANFYRPDNMVLVVCGDVEDEQILAAVDKAFPNVAPSPAQLHFFPETEPHGVAKTRTVTRMQVSKPVFCIGIRDADVPRSPEERLRRDLSMNLLCETLFSRSGSFYNGLFEENIISPSFSSGYSSVDNAAFVCLSGEAEQPQIVEERLWNYLDEVKKKGIDSETLERCRRVMYADELRAYDSTEEIAGRLVAFARDGVQGFSCPEVLQSITKEEQEQLLHEVFRPQNTAYSVIEPL